MDQAGDGVGKTIKVLTLRGTGRLTITTVNPDVLEPRSLTLVDAHHRTHTLDLDTLRLS